MILNNYLLNTFYLVISFYILGYQVRSRHLLLKILTGTKPEEDLSYDNINICIIVGTVSLIFTSVMEMLTYYLYNNKVVLISFYHSVMSLIVPSKD